MTTSPANPKTMAAFFIEGLTRGFAEPSAVIHWVDELIVGAPKTEDWMLDLSTTSAEDPKRILHHLYRVPGELDQAVLARLLFDAYKRQFEKTGDVDQAIRVVFSLAQMQGLPEQKVAEAYQLDHEGDHGFERAERLAELRSMTHEFFATYEERA
ncbi:MAG TPA: hypothetical protein VGD97_14550 [Lacunisphaera sp.]